MAINRYELVSRHNPILKNIDVKSPLTVGNGEFAYTVDVTGMQSLYDLYQDNNAPLCTMSQWGWHTTPVSPEKYQYTLEDLLMTEYDYAGRTVSYAVDRKPGNEEVYDWLRQNPHRMNLGRLGLIYLGEVIKPEDITEIHQTLDLYQGMIESNFILDHVKCKVQTYCHQQEDTIAIKIESDLLKTGDLRVNLVFPYGSPAITGSDWDHPISHQTKVYNNQKKQLFLERILDRDKYYVGMLFDDEVSIDIEHRHNIKFGPMCATQISFSITFSKNRKMQVPTTQQTVISCLQGWKDFWENGGAVDLHKSKDKRAYELERRIVLSQYVSAVNSCGSLPPQETGLTCNSWHGKFHLEMYLWHVAYLPLWGKTKLLEKSLGWYKIRLKEAKANAARNGFRGAKWPKQVAFDAMDSPSPIATLLIWQQPHIIYLLELAYQSNQSAAFLEEYWEVIKETADYMAEFAVLNPATGRYDLVAPLIPAQEAHNPENTLNPTFEVEYWRFTLYLAAKWAHRMEQKEASSLWLTVAETMAELSVKEGVYLAHANCPDTFTKYNKDHPSMLAAFGLIASDRVDEVIMHSTLEKTLQAWDFATTWGWDFAMMAMTATRLQDPETAINILLKDTPNNNYVISGNNSQKLREDLPVYLPGNGSLLLAVAMMTAGFKGSTLHNPGFPSNGMWEIEVERMKPFPY
ncbi:MAG: hypothetical protein ACYDEX_16865 [Mobilitalea sp.]